MKDNIIQLSEKEGITRMTIDSMPLWAGVQSRPGIRFEYPFSLAVEGGVLIRQVTEKEIIDKIVQAYQLGSYTFITAPRGPASGPMLSAISVYRQFLRLPDTRDPALFLRSGQGVCM